MSAPPPQPAAVPWTSEQPAHGVPSPSLLERADAGLERFFAKCPEFDVSLPDPPATA